MPCVVERLHAPHDARHRALRQRCAAPQRRQRALEAPAIRPTEIAAQQRRIDGRRPALIARDQLTVPLGGRPAVMQARSRQPQGSRPQARRHRPLHAAMAIAAPAILALIRQGRQHVTELGVHHRLDQVADLLAQGGRQRIRRTKRFHQPLRLATLGWHRRIPPCAGPCKGRWLWIPQGEYAFLISTRRGPPPTGR